MSSDGWLTIGFLGAFCTIAFGFSQFRACDVRSRELSAEQTKHEASMRASFVQACEKACGERGVHKCSGAECECK